MIRGKRLIMSYIQLSVLIHSENSDHSCAPIPLAFQDGILSGLPKVSSMPDRFANYWAALQRKHWVLCVPGSLTWEEV